MSTDGPLPSTQLPEKAKLECRVPLFLAALRFHSNSRCRQCLDLGYIVLAQDLGDGHARLAKHDCEVPMALLLMHGRQLMQVNDLQLLRQREAFLVLACVRVPLLLGRGPRAPAAPNNLARRVHGWTSGLTGVMFKPDCVSRIRSRRHC